MFGFSYADFHEFVMGLCLVLPCFIMARWVPQQSDRDMAKALGEAIDAHYPRKEFAEKVGLSKCQLSEQLACNEPFNFYRLAPLIGTPFFNTLLKLLARLQGGEYIDPQTVTLLTGAARLAEKRPVMAMLLSDDEREGAA